MSSQPAPNQDGGPGTLEQIWSLPFIAVGFIVGVIYRAGWLVILGIRVGFESANPETVKSETAKK
jgi:hypothetical protein